MLLSLGTSVNMVDVELLTTEVKWLASDYRLISIGRSKCPAWKKTLYQRLLITRYTSTGFAHLLRGSRSPGLGQIFISTLFCALTRIILIQNRAICLWYGSACFSQAQSIAFETQTNLQGVRCRVDSAIVVFMRWCTFLLFFLLSYGFFSLALGKCTFTLSLALHPGCSSGFPRPALRVLIS